ncbi:Exosome complex component CSL4 [Eumeta japonica]|uniref:Exosome complex component CSL4 n=1 Tax=Eumeta variegata TaxID=151549 RepID=A0A4C1SZ42_EUMVA|nr:Exosome complex component CSL4 [Eumeta japonica]
MAKTEFGTVCVPGTRLCLAKEHKCGPGTYEYRGYVYAMLAGVMKIEDDEIQERKIISIDSPRTPGILPKTGDIVTAKVTVVNSRVVQCVILCVGPSVLLPMMEVHWYHLSTAENELGVVIATAEGAPQGVNMVPISWSEMQCPKSLVKEPRKVARVLPENINDAMLTDEKPELKEENAVCNNGDAARLSTGATSPLFPPQRREFLTSRAGAFAGGVA